MMWQAEQEHAAAPALLSNARLLLPVSHDYYINTSALEAMSVSCKACSTQSFSITPAHAAKASRANFVLDLVLLVQPLMWPRLHQRLCDMASA